VVVGGGRQSCHWVPCHAGYAHPASVCKEVFLLLRCGGVAGSGLGVLVSLPVQVPFDFRSCLYSDGSLVVWVRVRPEEVMTGSTSSEGHIEPVHVYLGGPEGVGLIGEGVDCSFHVGPLSSLDKDEDDQARVSRDRRGVLVGVPGGQDVYCQAPDPCLSWKSWLGVNSVTGGAEGVPVHHGDRVAVENSPAAVRVGVIRPLGGVIFGCGLVQCI
jgi:hypothetical protein